MRPSLFILLMMLAFTGCKQEKPRLKLLQIKELQSYPSASAVVYQQGKLMIMGDDATALLVLDSSWNTIDSINLIPYEGTRMPKNVKADLEAATWFRDKKEAGLLLMGSGSLPPYRNSGWVVQPHQKVIKTFRLDTLYSRIQSSGINQLNIEGLAQLPGWYVLACRGNLSYQKNHLVFLKNRFWEDQAHVGFHYGFLGGNKALQPFAGVSGLDYSYRSDRLFLTASTEHTTSTSGDGAIGKSYLWIIKNMNRMVQYEAINPTEIFDLEKENARFIGAKIESVSVISETNEQTELVLVADNDDGRSTLFRVVIDHNNHK